MCNEESRYYLDGLSAINEGVYNNNLLRTKIERHFTEWMCDPAKDMYFANELFLISIRD